MSEIPSKAIQNARAVIAAMADPSLAKRATASISPNTELLSCVTVFHQVYGLPIVQPIDASPDFSHISRERLALRFALIEEEFKELCAAMDIQANITYSYLDSEETWQEAADIQDAINQTEERNIFAVADACADLKYVIQGFELEVGIPSNFVLREVQASNLTKLGPDGKPIYREDGKVLKGPNYVKADIAATFLDWGVNVGKVFGLDLSKGDV